MPVVFDGQSSPSSPPTLTYGVPWSEFPIIPSFPHHTQVWGKGGCTLQVMVRFDMLLPASDGQI